jgi:hypothetical protein
MTKPSLRVLGVAGLLFASAFSTASGQDKEVIKKKGYTLTFINEDKSFDPALKTRMIETFFKVYPELKKEYNEKTNREVTFVIDTAYKGVAATGGDRVSYSPEWFKKHPEDIDVVTHEVMHIVQAYGDGGGPWWVTEGIADYVRYQFGVDNAGAKWSLPAYKEGQKYDNSYRITARFLAWIEQSKPGIVKTLDKNMRAHTYTDEIWKSHTGKTLDELWAAYTQNPVLK